MWGGYKKPLGIVYHPVLLQRAITTLGTERQREGAVIRIQRGPLDRIWGFWQPSKKISGRKGTVISLSSFPVTSMILLIGQTQQKAREQGNHWGHVYRSDSQSTQQGWDEHRFWRGICKKTNTEYLLFYGEILLQKQQNNKQKQTQHWLTMCH